MLLHLWPVQLGGEHAVRRRSVVLDPVKIGAATAGRDDRDVDGIQILVRNPDTSANQLSRKEIRARPRGGTDYQPPGRRRRWLVELDAVDGSFGDYHFFVHELPRIDVSIVCCELPG